MSQAGPIFHAVIPARYAAQRFPGKVLADLDGLPLVAHVARAARASGAVDVVVATDDDRVQQAMAEAGVDCILTRADHPSGTDRVEEVATVRGWDDAAIVVNVQGDEPRMPPDIIAACAAALANNPGADIATPVHRITDVAAYLSPHVVKVVRDADGTGRYFSRAPIPASRDALLAGTPSLPQAGAWRHIGLYAYRRAALSRLAAAAPAPTERAESLEQLRALWMGMRIVTVEADTMPASGVDTPEDLERLRQSR